MELINHTRYPSFLFRTALNGNNMAAAAIIRVTYDIVEGKATPSVNQDWLLYPSTWESEYGPVEGDNIFRLGGVDVLIFGSAKTPGNMPLRRMEVKISIKNKLSYSMLVFGNRVWEKGIFGMSISNPEPFVEMPLTLYNAFGGKADWDGLKLPYGNNPYGKGYYWERSEAVNNFLPNIENTFGMINKWDDRPDPAGITSCPLNEMRIRGNIEYDKNYQIKKIGPRFFNTAFPKMIIQELSPGEIIEIEGMTTNGNFSFQIPKHRLNIQVRIGEKINQRTLIADQVGIVPGKLQAFITYRFPFRYVLEPMQIRNCEIFETD